VRTPGRSTTSRSTRVRYEIPKAFVVRSGPVTEGELMSWVSERVPSFNKVRRVEFVDEILRSASGKILRRVLVERERDRSGP
jgi:acyl-coenzyme A synthetase/AMP-(fatty) acid ligase